MTKLNVYVAGSSNVQELTRVKSAMARVIDHPNMTLSKNWVEVIEQHQGRANYGLTQEERVTAALGNLEAVASSDIIWLLAPNFDTRGAWVEIGFQIGNMFGVRCIDDGAAASLKAACAAEDYHLKTVPFWSSGNTKQSIFLALTREFETDLEAFMELAKLADAQVVG